MSKLPGFSNIPPKPLSKEEVTSTLLSGTEYYTILDDGIQYLMYPYDTSILLEITNYSDCQIFLFGKEHYSVLDLTRAFFIAGNTLYTIIGITKHEEEFKKDIYIDKLILNIGNFRYQHNTTFDIPSNVHINVLEITSPMCLFDKRNFGYLYPSKVIISDCYASSFEHIFNVEKDSYELFMDSEKQIPVSIKNHTFGKTHYFRKEDLLYIIDPQYIKYCFSINPDDPNTLIIGYLSKLYLEDDFIAVNHDGERFSINSVKIEGECYDLSLPNYIKKLISGSEIYGYLDISRCIEFQLDTLSTNLETGHIITYINSTIYVNSDQFSELQSSGQIVQRDGEDFWVLASTQEQTSRQNYAKVVIRE